MKVISIFILPNDAEQICIDSMNINHRFIFRIRNYAIYKIKKKKFKELNDIEFTNAYKRLNLSFQLDCYYYFCNEYVLGILTSNDINYSSYEYLNKLKEGLEFSTRKKFNNTLGIFRMLEHYYYNQEIINDRINLIPRNSLLNLNSLGSGKKELTEFLNKERILEEDFVSNKSFILEVYNKYEDTLLIDKKNENLEKTFSKNWKLNFGCKFFNKDQKFKFCTAFKIKFTTYDKNLKNRIRKKTEQLIIDDDLSSFRKSSISPIINRKGTETKINFSLKPKNEDYKSIEINYREKVYVSFKNTKVNNVKIEGQLILNGELMKKEFFIKFNEFWIDSNFLKMRITPKNGLKSEKINDRIYKFCNENIKNMINTSLFDYIISSNRLNMNQLPILFKLQIDELSNEISILISYKVNMSIEYSLKNIVVSLFLDDKLKFSNYKCIPNCNKFIDNTIIWQANEIKPKTNGNLRCKFIDNINKGKEIVKYLKISFQIPKNVAEEMEAKFYFHENNIEIENFGLKPTNSKTYLEYKVLI